LLARRWSPRAYDANRPVTRSQLLALIEAGRWAPSCNGDEPWRYLIWDRMRSSRLAESVRMSGAGQSGMGEECSTAECFFEGAWETPVTAIT
jgi:hypothetical protein